MIVSLVKFSIRLLEMSGNGSCFSKVEDMSIIQNSSDLGCEPVPTSICKGHPYLCLCKQEKVGEL